MGNCCSSDAAGGYTKVVVFDPATREVERVDIGPNDRRRTYADPEQTPPSVNQVSLSLTTSRPVNPHHKETVPSQWQNCFVYCRNPGGPVRRYRVSPYESPRDGEELLHQFNFNEYCGPGGSTERALYIGPIPN